MTNLKLVSNRYMALLNWHLEREGRRPMSKRTFMGMLSILDRHQRRLILRQFDELEGKAQR